MENPCYLLDLENPNPITILPPPTVGDWEGTGGGGTNSTVTTLPSSVLSLS